ncbi:hypothetical protein BDN70DRAFT_533974 [Pholiota conissans]|uniref:SPIN90/Ldb17 leucine-rich domain-containing protein n=1 Tax=Pholiota conissans TaxID=109636 RepID=A0A9P6CZU5_9AGAR|nr:hypothetical protein BDN70DRAFT_533974 [Pholiota conissans]
MVNVAHIDANNPVLGMQDDLGIVYLVGSAQQFWSELEDVLRLPQDEAPTLSLLDATLRRYVALCSTYHEQYLQSPLQLDHACTLLVESELFEFHSERMVDIIIDDAQTITDPHSIFIFYEILFYYGHHRMDFFRSHKRWQPLLPLLMDHILVEIDPDIEDVYVGTSIGRSTSFSSVPIPIEAKLRSLSVRLLYEVCKVQTLNMQDLKIFDDDFIDYLFELVEQTKYMHDDTFNYSVIKLITALNEQFMVLGIADDHASPNAEKKEHTQHKNRVIKVLNRRLGSCKTFGENMIFMLNRAKRTPEDFCMKLLILKILYVLFSNKETAEFFYTNDLCVLVDVFLRELADLDEESESLRHTYLRVLHPLLTKTQLKDVPYKRMQILVALESMISNSGIREVNATTKRLVERCLSGSWCVSLMELRSEAGYGTKRVGSPSSDISNIVSPPGTLDISMAASHHLEVSGSAKIAKNMKFSKSVENFGRSEQASASRQAPWSPLDQVRRPSNASVHSLPGFVAPAGSAAKPTSPHNAPATKKRSTSATDGTHTPRHNSLPVEDAHHYHYNPVNTATPSSPRTEQHVVRVDDITAAASAISLNDPPRRRPPPPAPQKRRKPPAIPIGRTHSGATITSIRSSEPSPLSKVHKPQLGVQQAS